jgi:hypothetical protein
MPDFRITQAQLQDLANYLAERPYKEVYGLVNMVASLPAIIEKKPKEPKAQPVESKESGPVRAVK